MRRKEIDLLVSRAKYIYFLCMTRKTFLVRTGGFDDKQPLLRDCEKVVNYKHYTVTVGFCHFVICKFTCYSSSAETFETFQSNQFVSVGIPFGHE